jgi:exopolysaccharide production protein ExoY
MKPVARWSARADQLSSFSTVPPAIGGSGKRGFDIACALSAILLLAPLLCLLALLVKASDGGKVFYAHKRIGRHGLVFGCLKFRTMAENGDILLQQHLARCPQSRLEWQQTRKLKNDPRVTRVGRVLRKLSLDELPQLFNILLGDMSVVGPRPVVQSELDLYGKAAAHYLASRPGLTGLWQVSGRNDVSYRERIEFDTHYVENWSFITDIKIIALTVPAVCASRGSY